MRSSDIVDEGSDPEMVTTNRNGKGGSLERDPKLALGCGGGSDDVLVGDLAAQGLGETRGPVTSGVVVAYE